MTNFQTKLLTVANQNEATKNLIVSNEADQKTGGIVYCNLMEIFCFLRIVTY